LIRLVRPWPVVLVVADHLHDLDEAEGDPQPPQGRELVIVDLRHTTIMPPSSPGGRLPPWPASYATASTSSRVRLAEVR
jgi:hypothetical protein